MGHLRLSNNGEAYFPSANPYQVLGMLGAPGACQFIPGACLIGVGRCVCCPLGQADVPLVDATLWGYPFGHCLLLVVWWW